MIVLAKSYISCLCILLCYLLSSSLCFAESNDSVLKRASERLSQDLQSGNPDINPSLKRGYKTEIIGSETFGDLDGCSLVFSGKETKVPIQDLRSVVMAKPQGGIGTLWESMLIFDAYSSGFSKVVERFKYPLNIDVIYFPTTTKLQIKDKELYRSLRSVEGELIPDSTSSDFEESDIDYYPTLTLSGFFYRIDQSNIVKGFGSIIEHVIEKVKELNIPHIIIAEHKTMVGIGKNDELVVVSGGRGKSSYTYPVPHSQDRKLHSAHYFLETLVHPAVLRGVLVPVGILEFEDFLKKLLPGIKSKMPEPKKEITPYLEKEKKKEKEEKIEEEVEITSEVESIIKSEIDKLEGLKMQAVEKAFSLEDASSKHNAIQIVIRILKRGYATTGSMYMELKDNFVIKYKNHNSNALLKYGSKQRYYAALRKELASIEDPNAEIRVIHYLTRYNLRYLLNQLRAKDIIEMRGRGGRIHWVLSPQFEQKLPRDVVEESHRLYSKTIYFQSNTPVPLDDQKKKKILKEFLKTDSVYDHSLEKKDQSAEAEGSSKVELIEDEVQIRDKTKTEPSVEINAQIGEQIRSELEHYDFKFFGIDKIKSKKISYRIICSLFENTTLGTKDIETIIVQEYPEYEKKSYSVGNFILPLIKQKIILSTRIGSRIYSYELNSQFKQKIFQESNKTSDESSVSNN